MFFIQLSSLLGTVAAFLVTVAAVPVAPTESVSEPGLDKPVNYTALYGHLPNFRHDHDPPFHPPPGHINTAPYGGPDMYVHGWPGNNKTHVARHVNHAPYGDEATYFEGHPDNVDAHNGTAHTLDARRPAQVGGITWCTKENFKGKCYYIVSSGGKCHNYPGSAWTSFGPDHGITCAFYWSPDCVDLHPITGIVWPGFWSLDDDWFLNLRSMWWPQSFKCHWL